MQKNPYSFDPIREDLYTVSTDLRQRRSCRHAIFVAIVGAMGTAGFALIALIQQSGGPNQWHKWILLGTTIPLLILSIGIATTINKARAINIRSGYLAAAAYYIQEGRKIRYFGGWPNALRAARICANLTFVDPEDITPCGRSHRNDCVAEAKKNSGWINETVQTWRREIIKSFTVLTSIIYGLLSLMTGAGIITAATITINWKNLEWNWNAFIGITIFVVPTILVTILTLFSKNRSVQSARVVVCYVMIVLGAVALLGAAIYKLVPNGERFEWISVFGLGGGLLLIASLGILLFDQVYRVRKGDYSLETYYHIWRLRFDRCPLMTGKSIYYEGQKPGIGTYKCLSYECLKGGQEIKKDRQRLVACDCGHSYFGEIYSQQQWST